VALLLMLPLPLLLEHLMLSMDA